MSAGRSFVEIDVDSLEVLRPRSVGVEHAGLSVMRELGFLELLQSLGFNRAQCAAAIGSVIGRMAAPGSELATWGWLKNESALGEILEFDFEGLSLMRLYRASNRKAVRKKLKKVIRTIWSRRSVVCRVSQRMRGG